MISIRAKMYILTAIACLSAIAAEASVEVFTLNSGDTFRGEQVSTKDGVVLIKTAYGEISVPVADIKTRELASAAKSEEKAVQVAKDEKAPAAQAAPVDEKAPAAQAAPVDEAAPIPQEKDPQWVVDYRDFVRRNFPEGWQFRIKGGIEFKKTDSSTFSFYAAFDVKKEWGVNVFTATAYYNYTSQTSTSGVKDVTIDNYGLNTNYKRFFNSTKTWYLSNILNYLHDEVKGINNQVDEAVTIGYRFDFKRYDLIIDIGPGPLVRYVDSESEGINWVAMALLQEDLTWSISKVFRLEQSLNAAIDVLSGNKYSVTFQMALIAHITEVADLALRYIARYDNISSTTVTTEQRFILAFEFPFNWK